MQSAEDYVEVKNDAYAAKKSKVKAVKEAGRLRKEVQRRIQKASALAAAQPPPANVIPLQLEAVKPRPWTKHKGGSGCTTEESCKPPSSSG